MDSRRLPLRGLGGHAQFHPRLLLQHAHDAEEILRTRIAVRRQHPVQAFAWLVDLGGKAFEANGGIYQVAQNGLACTGVAGKIGVDCLRKERLPETRIILCTLQNSVPKIPGQCLMALP
ncbi:MAG: hypothetical protein ACKVP2_03955 [Burkholderiales bacterium]